MKDFLEEKSRLRDFLIARGVQYDPAKKTWKCPNHDDEHPSAVIYENQDIPLFHCPVCDKSWTVIDVCGFLDNCQDFKVNLKSVRETLGIKTDKKSPIAIPLEKAKKIYTEEKVYYLVKEKNLGKIAGKWAYSDRKGDIIGVDIRFENGKKSILTFWYDGKSLRYAKAPILIYGLDKIERTKKEKREWPIMIHEGAKCAEHANKNFNDFINISWSGGSGKAKLAPWEKIKDHEIYIYPDDDDPGLKAAIEIKKKLPYSKIIKPLPEARKKKKKGADIIEALECLSATELSGYIFNPENHYSDDELLNMGPGNSSISTAETAEKNFPSSLKPSPISNNSSDLPFKILGIGDDGKAAFITEAGRLVKYNLDTLNKNKLMVLAGRWFWKNHYSNDGKFSWDQAIDDIIRFSQDKDFDENNIRGRGAWRDGEEISYHDGLTTYGKYEKKKIYLRLPRHDIGIAEKPASKELCQAIKNVIFQLSFETPADAVRALGWSVLGPFAGALKFRPAILLTGPSGSGKTTVTNLCIRKLADCEWFNGSESTVAGVRGKVRFDSRSIMFEETEGDTIKKKTNREELFSLMRVNVSDDAPDTVKGTKEGGFNSYKMQNMFGFIAVDPTIESVADENRIFRINMIKPKNGDRWKEIEKNLKNLLSEKNCRAIRSLTWNKLKIIFNLADRIIDAIREKTHKDYRSSYADALLSSAFMVTWTGADDPTDKQIDEMLTKYYKLQPPEEHRDEAEEFLDRLLEEQIEILFESSREKLSILECMNRICTNGNMAEDDDFYGGKIDDYRKALSRYGIRVDGKQIEAGQVAFANNHKMIKKITGNNTGYNRIFQRHRGFVDGNRTVYYLDGKNRRSTIIRGLLLRQTSDDKLEELMF